MPEISSKPLSEPERVTDLRLIDHVVVITGGSQGLGRAEALALAIRGASVVVADTLPTAEVVAEIERADSRAIGVAADVGSPDGAETVVRAALEEFGDITSVVNNAGIVRDRMSFNMSDDDWERVLAVNLSGSFYLSRAVLRHWRASPTDTGETRSIVNTTSESGLYGNAGQANYSAAKAGVAALTLTMATELQQSAVRVNAIAPRARTPMSLQAFGDLPRHPGFDPFAPEHVAAVVAWLVSRAARGVTGQVFVVHGAGIEVMDTWRTRRVLHRDGEWHDSELARLRESLFPDQDMTYVAPAVGDLFVTGAEGKDARDEPLRR